jgi:hypothetical protein
VPLDRVADFFSRRAVAMIGVAPDEQVPARMVA